MKNMLYNGIITSCKLAPAGEKKDIYVFSNSVNREKSEVKIDKNIDSNSTLMINPNPANKEITLTSNTEIKEVEIMDMSGVYVLKTHLTHNMSSTTIGISTLQAGVYAVKCIFQNENYLFSKLVISK